MSETLLAQQRRVFHARVLARLLRLNAAGVPSNADKHSATSRALAGGVYEQLRGETEALIADRLVAQTSGSRFEQLVRDFLAVSFEAMQPVRPGRWSVRCVGGRNRREIFRYEQFEHLVALEAAAKGNPELAAALGNDYTITPDIVVVREREPDEAFNRDQPVVGEDVGRLASLRQANGRSPLLHASVSCKWTLRSDRAQNARSEALNFVRNRKGRVPHVVVVTGEPVPNRIASIALGTGDLDCVYHVALPELQAAAASLPYEDAAELLSIMVQGRRLKDIADLPLDLAV